MNGNDGQTVAAIIAAVEMYLASERSAQPPVAPRGGVSAWRMAYSAGGRTRGFGANVSWRGRDQVDLG